MLALLATAHHCAAGPLCVQMVLLPRWHRTRQLVRSPLVVVPLAVMYGVLLYQSWSPDVFSLLLPGSLEAGLKSEQPRQLAQGAHPAWRARQAHRG